VGVLTLPAFLGGCLVALLSSLSSLLYHHLSHHLYLTCVRCLLWL
jgi:hypothetical protein